jgi:hypothetical protein
MRPKITSDIGMPPENFEARVRIYACILDLLMAQDGHLPHTNTDILVFVKIYLGHLLC